MSQKQAPAAEAKEKGTVWAPDTHDGAQAALPVLCAQGLSQRDAALVELCCTPSRGVAG